MEKMNFIMDGKLYAPSPRNIDAAWAEETISIASSVESAAKSAYNERSTAPKLSNLLKALNKVSEKDMTVRAVRNYSTVYVEISTKDDAGNANVNAYSVNSETGEFTVKAEKTPRFEEQVLLMAVTIFNREDVYGDEFRKYLLKWTARVNEGKQLSLDELASLCDSFYFTMKAKYSLPEGKPGLACTGELTDEEIAQIGRSMSEPEFTDLVGENHDFVFLKLDPEMTKKEEEEKVPEETLDEFFAKAKAGELRLPASWDFNQLTKVPDLSVLDYYVCSDTYKNVVKNVSRHLNKVIERMDTGKTGKEAIQNDYVNLILTGKPGTGKTTLAEALAATLQVPIYTCPSLRRGEEDEYQGKVKVNEDGFKFSETPFLEAYKNGGIVVLEEFNIIDPGVLMGVLGQAIEKPFVLNEDGYKPVERNPLCVVIATCNPGMEGSSKPNGAFVSRLPRVFRMDDPQDEDFIGILKTLNPEAKESDVKKVYKTFRNILKYLTDTADAKDVANELTLRHCSGAIDLILDGMSIKDAITNSIINTIFLQDEELAESTYESIVEPMR